MELQGFDFILMLVLTLILLGFKLILAIYLGSVVLKNRKARGYLEFDFLFGFFILIICLFFSRLSFMFFDLFLTKNNPEKQFLPKNVIFWKIGVLIIGIGIAVILFIIERVIIRFKLKAFPTILLIIAVIFIVAFPVNSKEDYRFISSFLFLAFSITVIIPAIFIYIGFRCPEIRRASLILTLGTIIFLIGTASVHQFFADPLVEIFGPEFQIMKYIPFYILKIIGLIIISYSATNLYIYNYFTKIDDNEI